MYVYADIPQWVPSVSPDLVSKLVEEWRQCNRIERQAGFSHNHRAALRALLRNTSTVQLQPPTDSSMQLAMPTRLPYRNASCRRTLQQCHTEHGPAHASTVVPIDILAQNLGRVSNEKVEF
jgi:hypothetical protein